MKQKLLENIVLTTGIIFLSGIVMMFMQDYYKIMPMNLFFYYFLFWFSCGLVAVILSCTTKLWDKKPSSAEVDRK